MTGFAERVAEHRRLSILRVLVDLPGYRGNESILTDLVNERAGLNVGRDLIRSDLAWLEEQGLVEIDRPGDYYLPSLTTRGLDAAEGRAVVPGVKRPSPR